MWLHLRFDHRIMCRNLSFSFLDSFVLPFTAFSDLHGAIFLGRVTSCDGPSDTVGRYITHVLRGKLSIPIILSASSSLLRQISRAKLALAFDTLTYFGILPEIYLNILVPGDAATTDPRSWP